MHGSPKAKSDCELFERLTISTSILRGTNTRSVPENFYLAFPLPRAANLLDSAGTIRTVKAHTDTDGNVADMDFESLVNRFYRPLFQFALSLTRAEADACDLTQQTFFLWASKGHQLRDKSKVKTWLFTTLHREFLETQRRRTRFPHHELQEMDYDLPPILPEAMSRLDGKAVLAALEKVGEPYQAALALFYLEDCSYKEIAEILDVPLGTVQSRIARGLTQLHRLLNESVSAGAPTKGRNLGLS